MTLSTLDWVVIASYLFLSLAAGVYFAKRGNRGFLDFILSGRKLPWWLAGTSLVATTFSVDTPLYVTELVRAQGISGNWQWWCWGIGGAMGVLSVFFFSRRWRRSGVVTEVEFVELRYSGKSAAFLRGFKALYFALVKNSLGLAALLLAMSRILEINVGLPFKGGMWIAAGIAFFYTLVGGLWGVVLTDFFQFFIAMAGSVILAIYVLAEVGGVAGLKEALLASGNASSLSFFPQGEGTLAPVLFGVYLLLVWWAHINTDGGGMFVQRMAACKNERHAQWGALWAVFANYCLRSWPWILAALASIVLLPDVPARDAYPMLIGLYLPSGLKGLMVVAFLAAFMSTISTLLNWGSSVLVNDFYKRFVSPNSSDRHYLWVSQLAILFLIFIPLSFTYTYEQMGIREILEMLLGIGAGFGPVLLARWFWWRINAWSEIAGMIAGTTATVLFYKVPEFGQFAAGLLGGSGSDYELAGKLLGSTLLSALIWVPVTFLTPPVPQKVLKSFFERLKPIGVWGKIGRPESSLWSRELGSWAVGLLFIFSSLFALGNLLLANWVEGLIYVIIGVFSGWILKRYYLR